jgi:hypothetical protein
VRIAQNAIARSAPHEQVDALVQRELLQVARLALQRDSRHAHAASGRPWRDTAGQQAARRTLRLMSRPPYEKKISLRAPAR